MLTSARFAVYACALASTAPLAATGEQTPAARSLREEHSVTALRDRLVALSPRVRRDEAQRVSLRAHETSRDLAREYRIAGPAQFHNFLVNAGWKKRGLCHHWTRDLMRRLRTLKLTTMDLHWGGARAGTLREHNAVVITARGEPFASGVVLDSWRNSGRLYSGPVATDRYPWKEDRTECFCARRTTRLSLAQTLR